MQNYNPGLEGVVVATTEISFIDGNEGRLLYRGYDINDLVQASYEEVVYLLWNGNLPTAPQLEQFNRELVSERQVPGEILDLIAKYPQTATPMEIMRTAMSALSGFDPEAHDLGPEANRRKAIRIVSKAATILAAIGRTRSQGAIVEPDPDLKHAANFLWMLFGARAEDYHIAAMDRSLTLHADNEMNAGTFAARVTASTMSDMYSAVTSAIGTLKGPLHGGANEAVMRMLLEIGEEGQAESYVRNALLQKKRIPGFGHRIYQTEDPRAVQLRQILEQQSKRAGNAKWFTICRLVEGTMNKEKGLYPNVDFYAAPSLYMMGVPVDLFTAVFAMSRTAGWTAQITEQYAHNRLIRPEGEYVGPIRRTFVPLERRDAQ
jgi:citrate synthase